MNKIYYIREAAIRIVFIEAIITSIIFHFFLEIKNNFLWIQIVTIPAIAILFLFLFLRWKSTRYLITVFYSFLYGAMAYYIGRMLQDDGVSARVILAFTAYFLSLGLHRTKYRMLKTKLSIKIVVYEN